MPLLGQLVSPRSPSTVGKTRNNSWRKETVSDVWGSQWCRVSGESFPAVVFHSILNSWRRILSANNSLKADDVRRQRFSLSVHLTVRFHCLVNMWCIPPRGGNTTRSAGILRVRGFDLDCEAVGAMRQNEAYLRCGAGAGRKRKDFNQMQWKWFFYCRWSVKNKYLEDWGGKKATYSMEIQYSAFSITQLHSDTTVCVYISSCCSLVKYWNWKLKATTGLL